MRRVNEACELAKLLHIVTRRQTKTRCGHPFSKRRATGNSLCPFSTSEVLRQKARGELCSNLGSCQTPRGEHSCRLRAEYDHNHRSCDCMGRCASWVTNGCASKLRTPVDILSETSSSDNARARLGLMSYRLDNMCRE